MRRGKSGPVQAASEEHDSHESSPASVRRKHVPKTHVLLSTRGNAVAVALIRRQSVGPAKQAARALGAKWGFHKNLGLPPPATSPSHLCAGTVLQTTAAPRRQRLDAGRRAAGRGDVVAEKQEHPQQARPRGRTHGTRTKRRDGGVRTICLRV